MTPELSFFARPLFYRTALLAALSAALVAHAPGSYAQGVDRDKNEIAIEARPTADQALTRFTTNITELAKAGGLPPFVGERQQIRKILEVMNKAGTKVVYVLGEAGSGKTAMIEYAGSLLEGAELFRLDLNSLEAGTGYRGMLEDRLEGLLEAFKGRQDRVLFIDEAHVAMKMPDFMDKLKPAMARGEVSLVLATTDTEYREFIEKDAALTSRASVYHLEAPSEAKIINVLRANKEQLQTKHNIAITNSALEMTARLTMRYYSHEPVLRKALDIIDRAAARMILNNRLGNYDLLALEDRLEANELHQKSLISDLKSFPDSIDAKVALMELREEAIVLQEKIQEESKKGKIILMEAELQKLRNSFETAQKNGEFLIAARIKNEDIPKLQAQIDAGGAVLVNGRVSNVLSDIQITHFVSQEVGIPDALLAENNQQKLARLNKTLSEKVLGQPEAIASVLKKTKIRMEGVEPVVGPQGVILMDGPTGVGKSEMMKAIALSLFGDANRLMRINMNNLGPHAQAQLFGQHSGIVDSEKGGAFDEVRRRPYIVVGLDEFDKAPREIWMSLLQILDEGVATDGRGRRLDFRNAMIVMQANFTGEYSIFKNIWTQAETEARFQMPSGSLDGMTGPEKDARVLDAAMARAGVPPEVRNRIGVKLVFNALDSKMAHDIARKILQEQIDHLWREKGVSLKIDGSVVGALARASFDPIYGARPIVQNRSEIISDLLADLHLQRGMEVKLSFVEGQDGRGGSLKATINDKEIAARDILYKATTVPKAVTANQLGEAGKPTDPTSNKEIVKRAARGAKKK